MADDNIKYSDLITPDDSINNLIKQLDEANDAYMNLANNIKTEAANLSKSLGSVNTATASGKTKTKETAKEADELAKAYKQLSNAYAENRTQIERIKEEAKEVAYLRKQEAKLANSAKGSYAALSAQYNINMTYLHKMSAEERELTAEGKQLVTETNELYQRMKELQKQTGSTTLNVGNYAEAAQSLKGELRELSEQLAELKLKGETNSEEYKKMAQRAGELRDAMDDARQEIKNIASDTSALDSVLAGAATAAGAFSVGIGAMELFGGESEAVAEAQKKLQAAIAITTGLQAVQNNLQKQSALMLGINKVQTLALAKAEALETAAKGKNAVATAAATVAQKAFNIVAKANPYVLLAAALVTVVGALAAFAAGSRSAAKEQERLNAAMKLADEEWEKQLAKTTEKYEKRITILEREKTIIESESDSLDKKRQKEDEILAIRKEENAELMKTAKRRIGSIEDEMQKLKMLETELSNIKNARNNGEKKYWIKINGEYQKIDIEKALNDIQDQVDSSKKKIEINTRLVNERANIEAEQKIIEAKRSQEDKKLAEDAAKKAEERKKKEIDIIRKTEDERMKLIADSYEQQREIVRTNINREIIDIKARLATEKDLTTAARKSLNDMIVLKQQELDGELLKIEYDFQDSVLALKRETQDLQFAALKEGTDKERALAVIEFDRKIEDIEKLMERRKAANDLSLFEEEQYSLQLEALRTQRAAAIEEFNKKTISGQLEHEKKTIELKLAAVKEGVEDELELRLQLIEKERQIEIAANNMLVDEMRQSELDINAKYDKLLENQTKDFYSKLSKDVLKQAIASNTLFGETLSENQLAMMKELLTKAEATLGTAKQYNSIWDVFGIKLNGEQLTQGQVAAIQSSVQSITKGIHDVINAWQQRAHAAVESANTEVEAAQTALDAEIEKNQKGEASDIATAENRLANAKDVQRRALEQERKAQQAQYLIDTAEQASSLVTGIAKIWAEFATLPAVAAILSGAMVAGFAASRITALQTARTTYGEGGYELLAGGSHSSGNDIDLGRTADGKRRRAEGGEFFAVINRRNSKKYKNIIPNLVNSLNSGTFEQKYLNAYNAPMFNVDSGNGLNISELNSNVRKIREQGEQKTFIDSAGRTVIVYKNTKRIITNAR